MIIELPTHLTMGVRKVKNVPLNLNHYRNADFNQLNNMKILFDKIVAPRLKDVPPMDTVALAYRLYMPTKRAVDISNVCCIVDKFFCDTLVNAKKIPDDNMEVITSIHYLWGGVDKENPRVEVTLMENEPMEITTVVKLSEADIRTAIEEYVTKELPARDHHNLNVELNFSGDYIQANVTIGGAGIVSTKPRGRPRKDTTQQTEEKPVEAAPEPVEEPLTIEEEPEAEEPAEEEGTIYPVPEQMPVGEATPEPTPVAQEAAVTPVVPSKGLFPSKASSSPTPTGTTKPVDAPSKVAPPAPAANPKSLFNLKGLTAPKSDAK